jgi:hypothetical protein
MDGKRDKDGERERKYLKTSVDTGDNDKDLVHVQKPSVKLQIPTSTGKFKKYNIMRFY